MKKLFQHLFTGVFLLGVSSVMAQQDCPVSLGESTSIGEAKRAFACRQFEDVVRSLRNWNAEDPKERFDRVSLYVAALANTGRHAETLVTVRYALRFVRL